MPIIDLGKLKFHWSGAWSSTTNYEKDDVVSHRQQGWIAKTDNFNKTPEIGADWDLLAGGFNFRGAYDATTQYFFNDVVTASNSLFVVTAKPPVGTGTADTNFWSAMSSFTNTSVTANIGDTVARDVDNVEKAMPRGIEDHYFDSGLAQNSIMPMSYFNNSDFTTMAMNEVKLTHSADQQRGVDAVAQTHVFEVSLDDLTTPTAYVFKKRLKVQQRQRIEKKTVTWDATNNKFLIDGVSNPRLNIRESYYANNYRISFHKIQFDVSDASMAGKILRFATIADGNHNGAATYADRTALLNNAYFFQNGTAPADDLAEEIYQKNATVEGDWWNNNIVYVGTPGTAGAYVMIYFLFTQTDSYATPNEIYYFESGNANAGNTIDIGREYMGTNPNLTIHRHHRYQFDVAAQGTSAQYPFYLKTAQSSGTGDQISWGVDNNGTDSGVVSIVTSDFNGSGTNETPGTFYYISSFGSATTFTGTITVAEKLYAPMSIIPPVKVFDQFAWPSVTQSLDIHWDKYEGWWNYTRWTITLEDWISNTDTNQYVYLRYIAGAGNMYNYRLLSDGNTYKYSHNLSYSGASPTGGSHVHSTNTSNIPLMWDSGNNSNEQANIWFTTVIPHLGSGGGAPDYGTNDATKTPSEDPELYMGGGLTTNPANLVAAAMYGMNQQMRDDNHAAGLRYSGMCYRDMYTDPTTPYLVGCRVYGTSTVRNAIVTVRGER